MSAGWVLHGILYGLSQAQLLSSGPPPHPGVTHFSRALAGMAGLAGLSISSKIPWACSDDGGIVPSRKRASLNEQALLKLLFLLRMSHWPKQVTWPGPDAKSGGTACTF